MDVQFVTFVVVLAILGNLDEKCRVTATTRCELTLNVNKNGYKNVPSDPADFYDWALVNGQSSASGELTGPTHGYSINTTDNCYLLFKTVTANPGENALLISPCYTHSKDDEKPQIKFFYNMYGRDIGSLNVYLRPGCVVPSGVESSSSTSSGSWETIRSVVGNQGNRWIYGQSALNTSLVNFQVIFEGISGNGTLDDVALDEIAIDGVQCNQSHFFCDQINCIADTLVCDGITDCLDRTDEDDCENCSRSDLFLCQNGNCIVTDLMCDSKDNCGDNSDELSCSDSTNSPISHLSTAHTSSTESSTRMSTTLNSIATQPAAGNSSVTSVTLTYAPTTGPTVNGTASLQTTLSSTYGTSNEHTSTANVSVSDPRSDHSNGFCQTNHVVAGLDNCSFIGIMIVFGILFIVFTMFLVSRTVNRFIINPRRKKSTISAVSDFKDSEGQIVDSNPNATHKPDWMFDNETYGADEEQTVSIANEDHIDPDSNMVTANQQRESGISFGVEVGVGRDLVTDKQGHSGIDENSGGGNTIEMNSLPTVPRNSEVLLESNPSGAKEEVQETQKSSEPVYTEMDSDLASQPEAEVHANKDNGEPNGPLTGKGNAIPQDYAEVNAIGADVEPNKKCAENKALQQAGHQEAAAINEVDVDQQNGAEDSTPLYSKPDKTRTNSKTSPDSSTYEEEEAYCSVDDRQSQTSTFPQETLQTNGVGTIPYPNQQPSLEGGNEDPTPLYSKPDKMQINLNLDTTTEEAYSSINESPSKTINTSEHEERSTTTSGKPMAYEEAEGGKETTTPLYSKPDEMRNTLNSGSKNEEVYSAIDESPSKAPNRRELDKRVTTSSKPVVYEDINIKEEEHPYASTVSGEGGSTPGCDDPDQKRKPSDMYSSIADMAPKGTPSGSGEPEYATYDEVNIGAITPTVGKRPPPLPQGHPSLPRGLVVSDDKYDSNEAKSNNTTPVREDERNIEPYAETQFRQANQPPGEEPKTASSGEQTQATTGASNEPLTMRTEESDSGVGISNVDKNTGDVNKDTHDSGWVDNTIYSSMDTSDSNC